MSVHIGLDLTTNEYRALAAIAKQRGIQAHVLVEQLVRHALATTPPRPAPKKPAPPCTPSPRPATKRSRAMIRRDRDEQFVAVLKLHGQGMNDVQIAAELGVNTEMARNRRVQLKLPAQGQGRPKNTTTNAAAAAETSK